MNFLAILPIIIIGLFAIYVAYKHFTTKHRIKRAFIEGNVIVSGRKRYGKDLLFQAVIKWRKETYLANIDYGGDYHHIDLKELELTPNTYDNFINGEVVPIQKNPVFEKHDIYISDGGIYLPSQADSKLHKTYPSMPITYALTGHMWANGIHINAQRIERVWKALREQADYFIRIRKRCLKLPFVFVVFTTEYDKYDSAKRELSPLNARFFNKFSKAETDKYKCENGFIKNGFVVIPKSYLKYDTRAFHKVIFGEEAPRREKNNTWSLLKTFFKKIKSSLKKSKKKD